MGAVANLSVLTIGEIARELAHAPDWLRVCGVDARADGALGLADACARAGINSNEVIEGLAVLGSDIVADARIDLDRLCRFIVLHHHGYVRRSLPVIQSELESLPQSAAVLGGASLWELFAAVPDELLGHLAKEENILFPAIEALAESRRSGVRAAPGAFATLLHPIRAMEGEHTRVEHTLDRMRQLTDGFTPARETSGAVHACYRELRAFDADLQQHVRLENELLFPCALELERVLA
jgi:regulator of cell morphogenesis and NO signaling